MGTISNGLIRQFLIWRVITELFVQDINSIIKFHYISPNSGKIYFDEMKIVRYRSKKI